MNPTNRELLERVAAGDDAAWGELVDRYGQTVWSITGNYRLSHTVREDVQQAVWLKLFTRVGSIRQPERLVGWLATVTRNECLDVVNRQARFVDVPEPLLDVPVDVVDPTVELVAAEERKGLAAAFDDLDLRCRELLTMCMLDPGLSYEEIAVQLQIPRGSIGPTRQRCLDKLRKMPAVIALGDEAWRSQ